MPLLAPEVAAPATPPSLRTRVLAALFIVFSLWELSPMLTASHVEAFSARLQTMAILLNRGQFVRDDMAYPLDIEYFYSTRGGTVHALAWLMRLTHTTGDLNFRLLIWASFAVLAGCCVVFVRRWSPRSRVGAEPEPAWAVLAVLVLIPGLAESAFFFADNLPSAAAAALALALPGRRTPWPRLLLAGAAFAVAVLLRTDALLAAPGLFLLPLLADDRSRARAARAWLTIAAGAAAVFLLAWRITGVSLAQSVTVGRIHNSIHVSWGDHPSVVRVVVLFFGPALLLPVLGAICRYPRDTYRENLVLVAWPALFYLVALSKAIQLRDYLLLGAPFVLLLGATGLRRLLAAAGDGPHRMLARAAIAVWLLSIVAPPLPFLLDGPRLPLGRLYAPALWRQWQRIPQDAVAQDLELASSGPPRQLVLSTFFQSDRFLHLALLEAGYQLQPELPGETCGNVEEYTRGNRTILHIRTENPYWLLSRAPRRLPPEYVRAFQVAAGLACVTPEQYDRATLLTWGRMGQGYLAESPPFARAEGPLEMAFPAPGTPHLGPAKYAEIQRVVPVDSIDVAHMTLRATEMMNSFEAGDTTGWRPPRTYAAFHALATPLVWQTLPHKQQP